MTIADKLTQIAENTPKVYEAGKAEGYTEAEAIIIELIESTIIEIVVPKGTKKIGACAFDNVPSLKKITIPEGVEQICSQALAWTGITELELPLSCHTLDSLALLGIWSCKTMRMGNVTSIGEKAFVQCNALVELDFTKCDSVPALASTNAFDNYCLKNNPKILVPAELYGEWVAATNWAEYAVYIVPVGQAPVIETPDYVSEGLLIENGVLKGRGACTDSVIVVPEEVEEIEFYCFKDDELIDTLILPESGCCLAGYVGSHSTLRVMKNYYDMDASFGLSETERLEFISVIGSNDIDNNQFTGLPDGIKYDFSRCDSVPGLGSVDSITVGEGTEIFVPLELYEEWIAATNWAQISQYIVVAI